MRKIILTLFLVFFIPILMAGCSLSVWNLTDSNSKTSYYELSNPQLILSKGPEGAFDYERTHTLSIIELNKNGYRFWGYYTGYDGKNFKNDIGLAYSNDLVNWTKEGPYPLISNLRWATAVVVDGVINLFGTRNYGGDSYIVRLVSYDGKNFTEIENVVGPVAGQFHQNPFIFYDENAGLYRLYYFHKADNGNFIEEKHSADITNLASAQPNRVICKTKNSLAAPSVIYRDGKYWLTTETLQKVKNNFKWETLAFVSDNPLTGFTPVKNHELLVDSDACYFPYIFDNRLIGVYSHEYSDKSWEMFMRTHDFNSKYKISLDQSSITLESGKTIQLKATATLPDGTVKDVTSAATWATSDNNIVKVKKGNLISVRNGSAVITVSYGGCSATATVTVTDR